MGDLCSYQLYIIVCSCDGSGFSFLVSAACHIERGQCHRALGARLRRGPHRPVQHNDFHCSSMHYQCIWVVADSPGRKPQHTSAVRICRVFWLRKRKQHQLDTGMCGAVVRDRGVGAMVRHLLHSCQSGLLDRHTDRGPNFGDRSGEVLGSDHFYRLLLCCRFGVLYSSKGPQSWLESDCDILINVGIVYIQVIQGFHIVVIISCPHCS